MMVSFIIYITSLIMIGVGIAILLSSKNLIKYVMALEIMFQAGNLLFFITSISKTPPLAEPRATMIILISVEACTLAVFLSIILVLYLRFRSLDVSKLRKLRW